MNLNLWLRARPSLRDFYRIIIDSRRYRKQRIYGESSRMITIFLEEVRIEKRNNRL